MRTPLEGIGFDRFPLSLLRRTYEDSRIVRLAIIAHGEGPIAACAGQMLSDALDGGITGMDDEGVVGMVARLDQRSHWVGGYLAVADGPEMPATIIASLNGRDAGRTFGVEALSGRTICDHGTSDTDAFYVKIVPDIERIEAPGIVALNMERVRLARRVARSVMDNATRNGWRFMLTACLVVTATMGLLAAILMDGLPLWSRFAIACATPLLMLKLSDGRDREAQERVEKRSRAVSRLA